MTPALYDPEDAARGWIEIEDRRNERHRVGLMTISLGVATSAVHRIDSVAEASAIATEMKVAAKNEERSSYRVDQRKT